MSGFCADPEGSVGAFLCRAGQHLRAAAIPQPRMEARMLLARAMGVTQEALLRDPRAPVPEAAAAPRKEVTTPKRTTSLMTAPFFQKV